MVENYQCEDKKFKKSSIQHKIFKFIILIIILVFFILIISFLKIELFKTNDVNFNLQTYSDKLKYLENIDKDFKYSKDNINIDLCDVNRFYAENIVDSKPCIIKDNFEYFMNIQKVVNENIRDLSKINFVDSHYNLQGLINKMGFLDFMKVLEFEKIFLFSLKDYLINKRKGLSNKEIFFLSVEGELEFRLSPITQINKIIVKKNLENNKNSNIFKKILTDNLFEENMQAIMLKCNLKKYEMLYIPSFFFFDMKELKNNEENMVLKFEFQNQSKILSSFYTILFDDELKSDSI